MNRYSYSSETEWRCGSPYRNRNMQSDAATTVRRQCGQKNRPLCRRDGVINRPWPGRRRPAKTEKGMGTSRTLPWHLPQTGFCLPCILPVAFRLALQGNAATSAFAATPHCTAVLAGLLQSCFHTLMVTRLQWCDCRGAHSRSGITGKHGQTPADLFTRYVLPFDTSSLSHASASREQPMYSAL
jgi:hypothetical protein